MSKPTGIPIPSAPRPWGRRKVLIDPRFQLGFVGQMLVFAALIAGVLYFANDRFFSEFKAQGTALGLPPDHTFFQFINEQRKLMNQIFLATAGPVFGLAS